MNIIHIKKYLQYINHIMTKKKIVIIIIYMKIFLITQRKILLQEQYQKSLKKKLKNKINRIKNMNKKFQMYKTL